MVYGFKVLRLMLWGSGCRVQDPEFGVQGDTFVDPAPSTFTSCVLSAAGRHMAHIRQSRPDSGLGFQIKFIKNLLVVPSSLGIGPKAIFSAHRPAGVSGLGFGVQGLGFEVWG